MDPDKLAPLPATYDRVAAEYARRSFDELQHKPLDRQLLAAFLWARRCSTFSQRKWRVIYEERGWRWRP